jgi:hypothetical protein
MVCIHIAYRSEQGGGFDIVIWHGMDDVFYFWERASIRRHWMDIYDKSQLYGQWDRMVCKFILFGHIFFYLLRASKYHFAV